MKRYISLGDIQDLYFKAKQRGFGFVLSKFNPNASRRTESAFDESAHQSSNYWNIPAVRRRWNEKISGNADVNYKQFMMQEVFRDQTKLRLLSLGSGRCMNELELAEYSNFEQVVCVDLSLTSLQEAEIEAKKRGIANVNFLCQDIYTYDIPKNHFDIVLFHSSLHHIQDVESFLLEKVKPALKDNGKLVINEFVGSERLQFPKHQVKAINEALKIIPSKFRRRYKVKTVKKRFYPSGILRMILADPSECIDSASIIPVIHKHFRTVIEKPYGGNIIMSALKDISLHFFTLDKEKEQSLQKLFEFEDKYLLNNPSDFIFGIYEK